MARMDSEKLNSVTAGEPRTGSTASMDSEDSNSMTVEAPRTPPAGSTVSMDSEDPSSITVGAIPPEDFMNQPENAPSAARRNEDIALDLFKFVANTTGAGRATAPSTGFTASSAAKPEDHVNHLLELYARCLKVVSGDAR